MIKSKIITMVLALITWTGSVLAVHGQGDFKNLDFEAADVTGYGQWVDRIPVNKALPGWKAYFGSLETDLVMYNTLGLGSSVISIFDTNIFFGFAPLDGNYSVILDEKQYGGSPSIGQTVTIPNNSLSVVFRLLSRKCG